MSGVRRRAAYWPAHTLTVDTFAAQHPGSASDQTRHSVAFHLAGLRLVVERCMDPSASAWLRQRGAVTAADVVLAGTAEEHFRMVRRWAGAVWEAWSPHHATVRAWTDRLGSTRSIIKPTGKD